MHRTRRLRTHPALRTLVCEHHVRVDDFITPLFIQEGRGIKSEIASMPGIYRYSLDRLKDELDEIVALGLKAVLLFGIPANKDKIGQSTWDDKGIIQTAIRFIKTQYPDLLVITDICFCEYTDHGHCGVYENGDVDNDNTLVNITKQALSHAKAGADMLAPSGMMDGSVAAIRKGLDGGGFVNIPIMAYAIKYASAYYGPFRDAADSAPKSGNRKSYQLNPANVREGLLKADYDDQEGADILMVKPALSYLDVVKTLRQNTQKPVACYNVSGEYAMIKAAAKAGYIDGDAVMMESLLSMKRAGADLIISYFAKDAARLLRQALFVGQQ